MPPSASRPRGSFRIASALHCLRVRSCESWSHFSSCGRTLSDYESERLIAQAYTIMLQYVQRLGANLEWKVGFEPTALEFCRLLYWASLPLPQLKLMFKTNVIQVMYCIWIGIVFKLYNTILFNLIVDTHFKIILVWKYNTFSVPIVSG